MCVYICMCICMCVCVCVCVCVYIYIYIYIYQPIYKRKDTFTSVVISNNFDFNVVFQLKWITWSQLLKQLVL